ncbi:utrophin-like isoform X1 [Stegostoma tigrinum]|uniref:utrophin-like isoform X1 n=1 Tax=Stegostoma tigrinum TaxID=3053191 RepID=UPI00287041C4|nr:utrophin-like isoform X1 [Stegostoma tigrinum]
MGQPIAERCRLCQEPTLEERAQRIAKAVRKQSIEVKENWEQLKTRASNWQKQVEKALEKLQQLQKALDDLEAHVITAEGVHTDQQPVGDLLIDSLQGHIDKTTWICWSCTQHNASWINTN